jgi:hypothetical protein
LEIGTAKKIFSPFDLPSSLVKGGVEFSSLFSGVPKLLFLVSPCWDFWEGFESFDNIVDVHSAFLPWPDCLPPLDKFANLRRLRLDVSLPVFDEKHLFDFDVGMPQLQTLELTSFASRDFENSSARVWTHLARLVPNLTTLYVQFEEFEGAVCLQCSRTEEFTVTVPKRFASLQKLEVDGIQLDLNGLKSLVNRFEAVRPGGVKEVIINGIVRHPRRECHQVCAEFALWVKCKKRQNRNYAFNFSYWGFPRDKRRISVCPRCRCWLCLEPQSYYTFKFSQP